MKTILFLLQKGQFSAVIGDKKCNLRGGESMSFVEFDSEKIVESFENSDYFLQDCKGWNDTKLFILYDSESAKYLFNIIDGFELKNKVRQCKNFSFQIKLEEKPIDLNGNVEELLKYLESGDAVVIAEKDKKIKALKNEIKEKNETIKKLESASSEKDKTISKLNKQVEKQKEDLKEMQSNVDPYSKLNFIDKGDYIELKKPIGTIKKIQKDCVRRNFSNAEKYANNLALDGGGWRLPTKEELKTIYKIKDVCGIKNVDGLFWCSKKNVVDFCCKTNGARASLFKFNLLTTDTSKNYYVRCVK